MPRGRRGKIKDAVARKRGARGKSQEAKTRTGTNRFDRYKSRIEDGKKWSYADFGRKFGTRGNRAGNRR
jgi:hypothetical protein